MLTGVIGKCLTWRESRTGGGACAAPRQVFGEIVLDQAEHVPVGEDTRRGRSR